MLRQIYFLSLLLCINISFCYDYLSKEELNFKPVNRKFSGNAKRAREKLNKHQDYEMFYDKEPIAHIDVANFIKNPDESLKNSQAYIEPPENEFKIQGSNYDNYDSLVHINDDVMKDDSQDYPNLESENMPEVNILNSKTLNPQHDINIDDLSIDGMNSPNAETDLLKINKDNFPFETKIGHISRTEKKCALKNMKIPFFSHDKTESTTGKKNKKRKLFNFRKPKKQTDSHLKVTQHNLVNTNMKKAETPQVFNKINKRSYYERLCPACQEKFFINSNLDLLDKNQISPNNIIHNSRQYYQRKKFNYPNTETFEKDNNHEVKTNGLNNNYENFVKEPRWKRNDETVEEKQKKVLEEIEKKVDSVKVNNQIN